MTRDPRTAPPRLTRLAFPAYAHLPGRTPHPHRDAAGHAFQAPEEPGPPDPYHWAESMLYLYGIDLFNHGYFWEAHEAWEDLWRASGRRGPTADFLKALIALAAAGLKARLGQAHGTAHHAGRATALLHQVAANADPEGRYMGLDLRELARRAQSIAEGETQEMEIILQPE